ncbi:MAG: CcmD family protein [Chloroflexi bacterium]|jgi:CcmD family protein|nr:CcmD family protein [Chloroflexota bacterium]
MVYLLVAYLVLWGMTFGYILALANRSRKLERDLELLARKLPEHPAEHPAER